MKHTFDPPRKNRTEPDGSIYPNWSQKCVDCGAVRVKYRGVWNYHNDYEHLGTGFYLSNICGESYFAKRKPTPASREAEQRKRFEAWITMDGQAQITLTPEGDDYLMRRVSKLWGGWLACAKANGLC